LALMAGEAASWEDARPAAAALAETAGDPASWALAAPAVFAFAEIAGEAESWAPTATADPPPSWDSSRDMATR
jgi:hypothetical protein